MPDHKLRRVIAILLLMLLGSLLELTFTHISSSQVFSVVQMLLLLAVAGGIFYQVRGLRADTPKTKREPANTPKSKHKAKRTAAKIDWSNPRTLLYVLVVCAWTLLHILVTGLTSYMILSLTGASFSPKSLHMIFAGLLGLVALPGDADLYQRGLISWRGTLEYGIVGLLLGPIVIVAFAGLIAVLVSVSGLAYTMVVAVTLYILTVLLLIFLPFGLLMQSVLRPLRRLEYDRAWRRANRIMRWLHSGELEGMALYFMGQYQAVHEVIQAHQSSVLPSLFLIGGTDWELKRASVALFEQGDDEQALTMMREIVETSSLLADMDCVTVLAEMYLRQEDRLPEALTLAAQSAQSLWHWQEYSVNYTQPERIATHAWALAANGEHAAAQSVLDQALHHLSRHAPLIQASVHYRAGQMQRFLGDEHRACDHFAHVIQLDPTGHYGQLSRAALTVQ